MNDIRQPIIKLTDGIWFKSGSTIWALPAMKLFDGQWCALVPDGPDPIVDPSSSIAQIFASLSPPDRGSMELLGHNLYRLPYREIQRLRSRLGYVQGYGGLLSSRSIRENISLPVSVHAGLSVKQESALIEKFLKGFSLTQVGDLKPHEVDGYTRWRTCVARALVLSPKSFVLEGIGDWEVDGGRGVAWTQILKYHEQGNGAMIICLSRRNPEFERWIEKEGGMVIMYKSQDTDKLMGS